MIVLRGGTLIDGTGRAPVRDATIVIEDGRIERVTTGPDVNGRPGAEVIDASGMTVLPGLIDCHDHLASHSYELAHRWGLDEPASTRHLRTVACSSGRSASATPRSAMPAGSTPASARGRRGADPRAAAAHRRGDHLADRRDRRPRQPVRPRVPACRTTPRCRAASPTASRMCGAWCARWCGPAPTSSSARPPAAPARAPATARGTPPSTWTRCARWSTSRTRSAGA